MARKKLVQTRLGIEFWTSDVIQHNAYTVCENTERHFALISVEIDSWSPQYEVANPNAIFVSCGQKIKAEGG